MPKFDDEPLTDHLHDELLDDLEVRCNTNVAAIRERPTSPSSICVDIHAANACDREDRLTRLHTNEVTTHVLTGIADRPVMAGSVFQLSFDRGDLHVPPTLAVCERAQMLGERSFELRFRFATPIDCKQL